jgi:hypothetical protein
MTAPTEKPRKPIGGILVVVILACCSGLLIVVDRPKNGITVEWLEADLDARLPIGSSSEEAEAWFASHNLKPYGIYRGAECQLVALVTSLPNDSLLDSAVIIISLSFTPEGRLEKRSVNRVVYKQ